VPAHRLGSGKATGPVPESWRAVSQLKYADLAVNGRLDAFELKLSKHRQPEEFHSQGVDHALLDDAHGVDSADQLTKCCLKLLSGADGADVAPVFDGVE
jgi:hypothetical protein